MTEVIHMSEGRIEFGDCRAIMRRWIGEGVKAQMCVTSPPYWGLRDYGVEGQLGLEATPDEYVANMVEVFRLVRDVLADDGTLWLNLGDSYAASRSYQVTDNKHKAVGALGHDTRAKTPPPGLKQKDLVGIPWRVAFALQADGWWLRQDIIWHKPNPMPESVRDRCTKAHEYLFLLSKSDRYYYNHEAIKEDAVCGARGSEFHTGKTGEHQLGRASTKPRAAGNKKHKYVDAYEGSETEEHRTKAGLMGVAEKVYETRNRRSVWTIATKPYKGAHFATFPPALIEPCILAGSRLGDVVLDPFMGSGTTAQVCKHHGRKWLGCDLNESNKALQDDRLGCAVYQRSLFG